MKQWQPYVIKQIQPYREDIGPSAWEGGNDLPIFDDTGSCTSFFDTEFTAAGSMSDMI
jgi:hypothetical protein